MRFFTRTMIMSKVLIAVSIVFFLLTVFGFIRAEMFNTGIYHVPATTYFLAISFTVFFVSLLLAIALRCIAKDAAEDLGVLDKRLNDK